MPHPTIRWFRYDHLPPNLQLVVGPFAELARLVDDTLGEGPEKATCLRKLLEAKDAGVRQAIADSESTPPS